MEMPPFVDVFPVGKGGFPASYVSLPDGKCCGGTRCEFYAWNETVKLKECSKGLPVGTMGSTVQPPQDSQDSNHHQDDMFNIC